MNKIRKILKRRVLPTVLGTIIIGQLGTRLYEEFNTVEIPETIRMEIDEDNISNIENLDINLFEVGSLEFLKNFNNLKSISLSRPNAINEKDIDFINSLGLEEIVLNIDFVSADIFPTSKIDLSKINNVRFNFDSKKETCKQLLFAKYSDIIEKSIPKEEFKVIKENDEWINNILSETIYEKDTEKDKMYKIANYICQNYEFDSVVGSGNEENIELEEYYNKYPISSMINNKKVICINYAALFSIMCTKSNINCITQFGIADGGEHAWNKITFEDGTIKYTDLSSFDLDNTFTSLLFYRCYDDEEIRKIAELGIDDIFLYDKEVFDQLYAPFNPDELYQVHRYQDYTYPSKNEDLPLLASFYLVGGLSSYGVASLIDNKKKKKIK